MAEKTTIRELLVALGVKTETKDLSRFDEAIRKTIDNMKSLASLGIKIAVGVGGMALLAREAIKVQTEVQDAKVGIATLYNALEKIPMKNALSMAADDVKALSKAAAQGVGGLQDYLDAYSMLLGPGQKAGVDHKQILEMTKNALTGGFALKKVAGLKLGPLDIVQAMTNSVNERITPIVTQALRAIDVSNEKFNAMNQPARWKTLLKAFGSFAEGAKEMGKTWSAQSATLKDNFKSFVRTITGPLFEKGTEQLVLWNSWIEDNREKLDEIATIVGQKIVGAFKKLKENNNGMKLLELGGTTALVLGFIPVLMRLRTLWLGVSAAITGLGAILGTSFVATIGVVIAVLAGLIMQIGIVYLWVNDLITFFQGGESVIGKFFEAFGIDKSVSEEILNFLKSIYDIFASIVNIVTLPLRVGLAEAFSLLKAVATVVSDLLFGAMKKTGPVLLDTFRAFAAVVKLVADGLKAISEKASSLKETFVGLFSGAANFVADALIGQPAMAGAGANIGNLSAGSAVTKSIVNTSNIQGSKSIKMDGDIVHINTTMGQTELEGFFKERDESRKKQIYSVFIGGER